ncbi:hypothetical protein Tco_1255459 [Tanacetum coccineum]
MGDENPIRTLRDYSRPSHEGYRNTIELPAGNNVNDPRDFAKPVKAITLPQDVPSTSDCHLIKLGNQVQCLMEAYLASTQSNQVHKITTLCEICSGPYDTQNCLENPEQAFVEYASSRTDETGEGNLDGTNLDPQPDQFASIATEQVQKLNSMLESLRLVPRSSNTKFVCSKEDDGEVMYIEIIRENYEPPNKVEETSTKEPILEYFDTFPTREELTYHGYLMSVPVPLIFLRNPIITEGCHHNLKISCKFRHVHIEKAYIDLNSPLNVMTRMMYNWTMRRKLDPREDTNGRVSNFTGRIKGMYVFIGNFTYLVDFMIVDDISSIIDPRLSQVVLGRPFIEVSNMTHNLPEGVVRLTYGDNDIAYKMPHRIEQYNSLSDLEKEHTKSFYLRNEEDKRRADYVMSKILGFYKECLELRPEYLTGVKDEGEIM